MNTRKSEQGQTCVRQLLYLLVLLDLMAGNLSILWSPNFGLILDP